MSAKKRLLDTADDLFYRQGYHQTGINQIIKEANTAKASFYAHFPSKKYLGIAYLKKRNHSWFHLLETHLKTCQHPRDKLIGLFDFLTEWMTDTNFRGCAFINMNSEILQKDDEMLQIIRQHKNDFRNFISELCSRLLPGSSNPSPGSDSTLPADTVYMLFEGALVECQHFHDTWPARQAKKAVAQLLKT